MFFLTQPQVQSTEVFTRMPERFRRPQVPTDWARYLTTRATCM